MAKKSKNKDPHFERESRKYDRPIPSREFITKFIIDHGKPLTRAQLSILLELDVDDESREALRRRINAMIRDGQVLLNRKGLLIPVVHGEMIKGRVIGHADGYGFLQPDEGGDDLFLSPKEMRQVLDGDRVIGRVTSIDQRGRKEGTIIEVLERAHEEVVGRFFRESGICFVSAENKRIAQDILIPHDCAGEAKHGQIVVAKITQHPTGFAKPVGKVVEVLGDHRAPGMEIDIASRVFGIPTVWPDAVKKAAAKIPVEVPDSAKKGRVDLRDTPLVTIDGEDARDFDDAVYCKPTDKGWKLLVAIADVAHYVRPTQPLDDEAQQRGTSVYFPGSVIPMLPEVLSNGLCSLNPEVDRLCMVCEMQIEKDGSIKRSKFYEAVMRSHARLTYNKVAAILVDKDPLMRNAYSELVPQLENLYDLYKAFRKARDRRGAIDFDTVETKVIYNDQQKIEAIVPTERNDAHKLIEECMIAANVSAAKFLKKHKINGLYRVHDGPKEEKLEQLYQFLGQLGMVFGKGEKPTPHDYAKLSKAIEGRPDAHLIQMVMLRSLAQAVYSPTDIGHFGLALEHYAHFTSPIRRYPDLVVHRAIKHILQDKKPAQFVYDDNSIEKLGEHCSMTERRADDATRDAMTTLKCQFMEDKVGQDFAGVISGVTSFGLFVELKDIYIEGLVHVTSLGDDYYHFDPVNHKMVGERSGASFQVGDTIQVLVARVDVDDKKIDLVPAKSAGGPKKPRPQVTKSQRERGSQNNNKPRAKKTAGPPRGKKAKRRSGGSRKSR